MDKYVIEFEDVKSHTLKEFIELIETIPGKKLSEFRLIDLTYENNKLINPGHGVYVFRDNNKNIILVGKATSTSFTERIAKHFDIRPGAWFNRLMYVVCCRQLNLEKSNSNYLIASKHIFENVDIVLINFIFDFQRIPKIETLLRGSTNTLNKFKNRKEGNLNKKLIDY